ncbi:MAG TPA: glycosyltransferase [bacterium]|nr:glycosyltransferase [bacterium]
MRIAVIVHRLGPYHVARLNALAQRCEVTVLELTGMDKTYAWDKVSEGCHFERVTLFDSLDTDAELRRRLPLELKRSLGRARPEAVAAPGWGFAGALAALDWCLQNRVPAILMTESQATDHPRSGYKERLKALVVGRYSAALVGGQTSADYATALGMPRERIFAGYDVVDNRHFTEGAARARADQGLRQAMGLPPRYWLASNRFVPPKNLPMLLKAYARYRGQAGEGAPALVLLGDGPLKPELLALRRSLGLESQVLMPGFAQYQSLPAYYGLASAFVHVSTVEPWGLVINEAMAAGLPVLCSNACGCFPDLLLEGRTGLGFDPRDEDALVGALAELGGMDTAALESMGRAGQAHIAGWSPDRFGESMAGAAQAALAQPRPGWPRLSGLFLRALARAL